MKKIYYLLVLLAVVITSCQKQPVVTPGQANNTYVKSMNLTLTTTDYQLLPSSDYPHSAYTIDDTADAHKYIPIILNARDPQLDNGSVANVTYTVTKLTPPKLADSLLSDIAYTLTDDDYLLLPNNTFKDFSAAQILAWLPYKYPAPSNNQLAVLTFAFFSSGTTTVTQSFLYHNGAWIKAYMLTSAQYSLVGKTFGDFSASDAPSLPGYLNQILKNDPILMATTKTGDVQYVSYKYFATNNYQRILPLTFDGINWTNNPPAATMTLEFIKKGGTWIPDPTIYYTLGKADYTFIGTTTAGTAAARANVAQFGDFNISATTDATYWSDDDINAALIAVLKNKYPSPTKGQVFSVTYEVYKSGVTSTPTKTFTYDGTNIVSGTGSN